MKVIKKMTHLEKLKKLVNEGTSDDVAKWFAYWGLCTGESEGGEFPWEECFAQWLNMEDEE